MRNLRSTLVLLAVVGFSPIAAAQQIAPVGMLADEEPQTASATVSGRNSNPSSKTRSIPLRITLGTGAAVAGGFGALLLPFDPLPHTNCDCGDQSLMEALERATLGAMIASAVVASAPQLGSTCGYAKRLAFSALGSGAIAIAGGFIGAAEGGNAAAVGFFGGAGLGSGLGAALCM